MLQQIGGLKFVPSYVNTMQHPFVFGKSKEGALLEARLYWNKESAGEKMAGM